MAFARNIIIFDFDNSSSLHTNNTKNNFLMLSEGPTDDINGSVGASKQRFSINFSKKITKMYLKWHYNGDNSYLF